MQSADATTVILKDAAQRAETVVTSRLQVRPRALDAADCGNGILAEEVLARPSFTLSATKMRVDLVALSVIELGLQTGNASLAEIYARAKELGFRLAAAEVGPQLRLQYSDQPIGESLYVGMEPNRSKTPAMTQMTQWVRSAPCRHAPLFHTSCGLKTSAELCALMSRTGGRP